MVAPTRAPITEPSRSTASAASIPIPPFGPARPVDRSARRANRTRLAPRRPNLLAVLAQVARDDLHERCQRYLAARRVRPATVQVVGLEGLEETSRFDAAVP